MTREERIAALKRANERVRRAYLGDTFRIS